MGGNRPRLCGWRLAVFRVLGFLWCCHGVFLATGYTVRALASGQPVAAELWGALGMAVVVGALTYLPGGIYDERI